jgi:hypothetical protein
MPTRGVGALRADTGQAIARLQLRLLAVKRLLLESGTSSIMVGGAIDLVRGTGSAGAALVRLVRSPCEAKPSRTFVCQHSAPPRQPAHNRRASGRIGLIVAEAWRCRRWRRSVGQGIGGRSNWGRSGVEDGIRAVVAHDRAPTGGPKSNPGPWRAEQRATVHRRAPGLLHPLLHLLARHNSFEMSIQTGFQSAVVADYWSVPQLSGDPEWPSTGSRVARTSHPDSFGRAGLQRIRPAARTDRGNELARRSCSSLSQTLRPATVGCVGVQHRVTNDCLPRTPVPSSVQPPTESGAGYLKALNDPDRLRDGAAERRWHPACDASPLSGRVWSWCWTTSVCASSRLSRGKKWAAHAAVVPYFRSYAAM